MIPVSAAIAENVEPARKPIAPGPDRRTQAVEREAVIAMLERERRSLTSSLIALALLAVGVALLPTRGPMAVLLVLRAASFLYTREAASELERRVRNDLPLTNARRQLVAGMVVTGITLALLLWPQPPSAPPAAVATIQVVVLVAVTLIPVTLAALPRARDAMLGSFFVTISTIIYVHPAVPVSLIFVFLALVVGVRIYSSNTGRHILSSAHILIENRKLSEELASALARAEFLGSRDPLTGLFNRNRLYQMAEQDDMAARRTLVMIDLDHFKSINDRFGHGVGDRVLVASARAIGAWMEGLALLREPSAFRLGGEEFLVVLEDAGEEEMIVAAEALRRTIESVAADPAGDMGGPAPKVTASIGLAAWHPLEDLDVALARADLACYEAKDKGRNRVARAA